MSEQETIKIGVPGDRERRRRKREIGLALFCVLVIGVLTWVELKYLGVGSYLFLGLFNLNFILLMVIFFVVARNGVKLLLERRRRVLGSRLRTRLVLAFICLSFIPTVLMFAVSVKFVQTSVDYWFQNQVEESMEQSLELGRAFYSSAQTRLQRRGENILKSIRELRFAWGGKTMDNFLQTKLTEYDLSLLGVVNPDGTEQNWHGGGAWEQAWPEIKSKIDWKALGENPRWWSTISSTAGNDLVMGILPVDEAKTGWLVLGESIGQGVMFKLDQVVRGLDEYRKLKSLKYPLKITLYLTLGVMTMLIILGSVWFGFRLAKELSAPIQALAAGTQRIARGDLTVRLEDRSKDEMGFLVQSFNRMAEDLEESQKSLKDAYERLSVQNLELEERGRYMEAVLNNITAGVISLDNAGRISTVNNAAQAMLGLDQSRIKGKLPLELLYGEFAEIITEVMGQLGKSPASQWQRQLSLRVGGRDAKFLVNVVALKAERGWEAGMVAVFEDITELEKMQRLAAWREVARRIAHEIKNPLTPIKLAAQRLYRKFGDQVGDPVFAESIEVIVAQVEHMQQMVTEFSSYAKLPEVSLAPGFLAPLLEEVAALFEHSHRQVRWSLKFETTIPEIRFDREGVRRVFINLLTNAAEALEGVEDGSVEIIASHDTILGLVRIEVRDNGPGLSPDDRTRMFEPYFSSKKSGTGLGLTIVKSIVTDHRGFVRVKPNSPHGTIFVVELPVG